MYNNNRVRLVTLILIICSAIILDSCVRVQNGYYDDRTGEYLPSVTKNRSGTVGTMPQKPGACFAKCLIPDEIQKDSVSYYVFTGDPELETVDTYEETFVIQQGGTKWVKKKADRNCLSANPDDCLVWCLQSTPEIKETRTILIDTTQTQNFQEEYIVTSRVVGEGGFTEWREIVCEKNLTSDLIGDISYALIDRGYQAEDDHTYFVDKGLKAALVKYQKDNGFPVGQFDLVTLEALGVQY